MKTAIYFCNCGTNISEKIDPDKVCAELQKYPGDIYFKTIGFACGEDGKNEITDDIKKTQPDRVIIAACSPRDHEETFRECMSKVGLNPYLMQMVNIREHIAWVTEDNDMAVKKTVSQIIGALNRVKLHEPLEVKKIDISTNALVIGAGPAGLKAALALAEAGRKVTLVEKEPIIGGMPVKFEEVFPRMECGPCMLEPMLAQVFHGPNSKNIELFVLSELEDVKGSFGNFIAKIRKKPRYVLTDLCIGCGECSPACPVETDNTSNCGLSKRKAIDSDFFGGLPSAPFIKPDDCLHLKGEDCNLCREAGPLPEAIDFDDCDEIIERNVGAIILAIGAELYDVSQITGLGYRRIPEVYTSFEIERILAASGPTGGKLQMKNGKIPENIAIIHCAGSLNPEYVPYCSEVCCQSAFKFNRLISHKIPEAKLTHFCKTIVVPGKEEFGMFDHAKNNPNTKLIPYTSVNNLQLNEDSKSSMINIEHTYKGKTDKVQADMVILCTAIVPSKSAGPLGKILEVSSDKSGFYEELHNLIDVSKSKIRGIHLAGSCQAPMGINSATSQGMAAAGYVLSSIIPGRQLEIEPVTAEVNADTCSGCKTCIMVCPYKAISFLEDKEIAEVNAVLCVGCGTCVAACPGGSIKGNHFTDAEIFAEIEGVLYGKK